jgi:hypothetical protein
MRERGLTTMRILCAGFLFVACVCSLPAGTIVSITGPPLTAVGLISQQTSQNNPTAFSNPQYIEASWSQSRTYSNVAISVLFGEFGNALTGTAYLTTQIGSGTTVTNEVTSAAFLAPNSSSALVQVLSIPSLGAGTYHLVIVPTGVCSGAPLVCGIGNWWDTTSPSISTDTGVSFFGSSVAQSVAAYGPASNFGSETVLFPQEFSVTGDSTIPEPSMFAVMCLAIATFLYFRKRQFIR